MPVCSLLGNAKSEFVRAAEYLLEKNPWKPNKLKDIDPEEIRREVLRGGGSYPTPAAARRPLPTLKVDYERNLDNTVAYQLRKFVREQGRHHKLKDLRLRFGIDKGRVLAALGPCLKSGTVAVSPMGYVDVLDPDRMPVTAEEIATAWVARYTPKGLGLKAIQSLHAVGIPMTVRDLVDRLQAQNPGSPRGSLEEAIHRQTTRGCISRDANGLHTVS
jgi:hypothetical protein